MAKSRFRFLAVPGTLVAIKRMKEEHYWSTGSSGMPPVAFGFRSDPEQGAQLILGAMAPQCDKRLGFAATAMIRAMADPDRLVLANDAFLGTAASEEEARAVGHGSLQQAFEAGVPVREAILALEVDRGGRCWGWSLSYETDQDAIRWRDVQELPDDRLGGTLVALLRRIMTDPDGRIADFFRAADYGLPSGPADEAARRHSRIRRGARFLWDQDYMVLLPEGFDLGDP